NDDPERLGPCEAEQRRLGRTIVDVVNDLGGLEQRVLEHTKRGFGRVVVDGDTPMQHLPFPLQTSHPVVARLPVRIVQPGVVPHMELLQRQGLDAEILSDVSVLAATCPAGNTAARGRFALPGHSSLSGGTLVATWTRPA